MMIERTDDEILARVRRLGLRRTPIYTYMSTPTVVALAWAFFYYLLDLVVPEVDEGAGELFFVVMAGIATFTALIDVFWAWFLARRLGVARILKARTRIAEEAADRDDHHAVLAALNPVRRFWGTEEMFLTARSRIALKKTGEL